MWDFKRFKDDIAIVSDRNIRILYSDLDKVAKEIAEAVGSRCHIFCLCKNEVGSIAGYAAFVENNIVPLLLNANMDKDILDNLIEIYKPSYMWLPLEMTSLFNEFVVVYDVYGYALIANRYKAEYELNPELCLLLTTSGSTGSPKLVRQSYKNVRSNACAIVEYLGITKDERPITTLPMNYTYGLSIINSHFMVGATLLVTEKSFMQKEFWSFLKDLKATSFGGVPYTYEILDKLRFYRMDLPSLRYITQAGGKLTPKLHEKFAGYCADKGIKFVVMYGQCEATARMGYLPPENAVRKCGSMGIPIPGGRFRLIDDKGNDITEPDITGELVYEGDNVTLGYAECTDDLAKGDERNGVLYTGDMARFDSEGYYYIVGRKKRFLKIFGNRVNLDEVDRIIKSGFDGVEVASSGVDDHLTIFLTDESKADEIKSYISEKTGLNQTAFRTVVIKEIPKNDSGKVLYKELEKFINDGELNGI